jgi:hypothetical protein
VVPSGTAGEALAADYASMLEGQVMAGDALPFADLMTAFEELASRANRAAVPWPAGHVSRHRPAVLECAAERSHDHPDSKRPAIFGTRGMKLQPQASTALMQAPPIADLGPAWETSPDRADEMLDGLKKHSTASCFRHPFFNDFGLNLAHGEGSCALSC